MLVIAGPGSGKTTVITNRILSLIRREHIPPENILVITFTRAAAAEMKQRFLSLSGAQTTKITFGTFHSVFFQILRYAYQFRSDQILPENTHRQLIQEICRHHGFHMPYEDPFYQQMISAISRIKNGLAVPENVADRFCVPETIESVLRDYQQYLKDHRYMDFDDIQIYCRDLLQKRSDILAGWQGRYRYILVDEFQDCSPIQYELTCMLAAPENNLFVVGDDDQSVYSFRGADPLLMQRFLKDFPEAEQLTLSYNYRSVPPIIRASGELIGHNSIRIPKRTAMASDENLVREGMACCLSFRDQRSEFVFLTNQIRMDVSDGSTYHDIAVLTRTNQQLSSVYECLESYGIPCRLKERIPNLYQHWIAQDVTAYLRLSCGKQRRMDFLRIMNRPNRYLARDLLPGDPVSFPDWCVRYAAQDWIQKRIQKLETDLSVMGGLRPYAAMIYLRKAIGYEAWLSEYAVSHGLDEESLTDILDELSERAKDYDTILSWLEMIGRIESGKHRSDLHDDADAVCLLTYHGAKGLEFDTVFLPDLCEGIVPWHRAETPEDTEEERRMLYVAMTRAKKKLFLLTAGEIRNQKKEPSCFLAETGIN